MLDTILLTVVSLPLKQYMKVDVIVSNNLCITLVLFLYSLFFTRFMLYIMKLYLTL